MASVFLATLLPASMIVALIFHYGVDVPYWDEWSLIDLLSKAHTHQLSFADLSAQHNEHRLIFPKLLFLALDQVNHWSPRAEMFLSVSLCTVSAFCLQNVVANLLRRLAENVRYRIGDESAAFFSMPA